MNYLQPSQWTATTDAYNNQIVVGGSDYWVENAGKTWSLTAPSTNTLRFEVHSGDVWAQGDGTITPLKNRSEIAEASHYSLGTDIHVKYGWTIEPGAANSASWLTTAQFRQVANDPYSAPFGIMMNGEKMRISLAEGGTSGSNYNNIYVDSQNMVRGHEYQMQIDVRFDPVHGHLDVIRDGVTLVNYDGPVGWSDLGGVYWKEGVYRADSPETMAMDYSNLSITTGSQTTTPPATPTAPAAPTGLGDVAIVGGYVNAAHDTASQALTGAAAAGSTVTVYDGTAKLGVATANSSGQWSYTLGHLADGSHSLTATATNAAGGVSAASTALSFAVDTQAPAAPTGLADGAIVNGVVDAAHDTASQALTGAAAAGSTVTVYDGAAKLGVATANSSGQWSYTLGQLADGSHSLTATAADAAGNVSPTSGALQFTVNTQAAAAPTAGTTINGTSGNESLWGTAAGHDAINGLGGNDIIFGVGPAESLNGGSGNDMLFGRGDGDTMTGGTGNDFFVFDTAIHNTTATDFDPLQDIILLQHDVFKNMAIGKLSSSDLYIGTAAQNSSQHIIYNPTTGNLMYDSDGSGSAQAQTIAHLQTGLSLHSWDFTVY